MSNSTQAGYAPPPPRSNAGKKEGGFLASLPSAAQVADGYVNGLIVVGATALTTIAVVVAVEAVRGLLGDDKTTPAPPAPQGGETPPQQG